MCQLQNPLDRITLGVNRLQQTFIIKSFSVQIVIIKRIGNELYGLLLMSVGAETLGRCTVVDSWCPEFISSRGFSRTVVSGDSVLGRLAFCLSPHVFFFHPSACCFLGTLSPSTPVVNYTAHSHKLTPKGFLPLAHRESEGRGAS